MNAQPPPKETGVAKLVPAPIAEKLDDSPKVRDDWREFINQARSIRWSTGIIALSVANAVGVYQLELPFLAKVPGYVASFLIAVSSALAIWATLTRQPGMNKPKDDGNGSE